MSRKLCEQCQRPASFCYCHLLRPLAVHRAVLILQHAKEAQHPLNTARIAQLCLQRCTTVSISDSETDAAIADRVGAFCNEPVLIYPGAGSRPLQDLSVTPATTLLFLDANWRKSRRILLQSRWLQQLPRFALAPRTASRYRLRREPKPEYCSTLEAIAATLQQLDNSDVANMLEVMDWMISRQIAAIPSR